MWSGPSLALNLNLKGFDRYARDLLREYEWASWSRSLFCYQGSFSKTPHMIAAAIQHLQSAPTAPQPESGPPLCSQWCKVFHGCSSGYWAVERRVEGTEATWVSSRSRFDAVGIINGPFPDISQHFLVINIVAEVSVDFVFQGLLMSLNDYYEWTRKTCKRQVSNSSSSDNHHTVR